MPSQPPRVFISYSHDSIQHTELVLGFAERLRKDGIDAQIDLGGKHTSEVFRGLVPGARVVKAFNHLDASVLPEPALPGGQRALFYSGDDADAKAEIRKIVEQTGHFPVDLGALNIGGPLASMPFGSLATVNFIRI